jgi:heme exporter protein D
MTWDSWSAFFDMGGYGLYVWGSVLVTFGLMFGEMVLLAARWNAGLDHLGNWLRNEQKGDDENQA